MSDIDLSGYQVTDTFFGAPYIEIDEARERPSPHRFIEGGFAETDTRFAFYFPPAEQYQGRMFQPLEGGHGGHTVTFGGGMLGEMFQRIALGAPIAARINKKLYYCLTFQIASLSFSFKRSNRIAQ